MQHQCIRLSALRYSNDYLCGVLPIPAAFDPLALDQIRTRPAIIEAMQYLIGDDPDPRGSDGPGS